MNKLIFALICIVLLIAVIVFGVFNYNSRKTEDFNKESFSFLNQFPYEMQNDNTMI